MIPPTVLARWREVAVGAAVAGVLVGLWASGRMPAAVAATLLLGAATVWLGWGARASIRQVADVRVADRRERRETALRAALLEQLDECRRWLSRRPEMGVDTDWVANLQRRPPALDSLNRLLRSHSMNPAARSCLLARIGAVAEWADTARDGATREPGDEFWRDSDRQNAWWREWERQLEIRQEILGLVLGAATEDGLSQLVKEFADDKWLEPRVHPISRVSTEAGEVLQLGLPPWPSDEAWAEWSPRTRDERAQLLAAAKQERINEALQQGSNPNEGTDGLVSTPPPTPDL